MPTPQPGATSTPSTPATTDMASLVAAGTDCLNSGDLRGALANFEAVVNAFPDRPEGHNNLGALYTSLSEHAKAEACFSRVAAILPENPSIYYNRGMARSSQQKFDGARADFLKVLEYDPCDADCLNNLGVMEFLQGRFKDARERFQQALAIKPAYERALLNLCDVETACGHQPQAVALCEEYLQSYSSQEVRRMLMDLLASGCRAALDKAGRTAETILATASDDPAISRHLGRINQAKALLEESAAF